MVRGQDVGGTCDLWQHDSLAPSEPAGIGHAMSGHTATTLRSIKAIMNATAVFISNVDVRKGNPLARRFIRSKLLQRHMRIAHPGIGRLTIVAVDRAKRYDVRTVPDVVIDGKLADCCSGRGPEEQTLWRAGIGVAL